MDLPQILKSAAKTALDARHWVSLEVRTYGILIRASGEAPSGEVAQIGRAVAWEALEHIEHDIEICLIALDQAIEHGDIALTTTA